jgi:hypothetical protein
LPPIPYPTVASSAGIDAQRRDSTGSGNLTGHGVDGCDGRRRADEYAEPIGESGGELVVATDDPMTLAAIGLLHRRDLRREALRHLRRRQHVLRADIAPDDRA